MLKFPETSHGRNWTHAGGTLRELRRVANERAARQVSQSHQLEDQPAEPLSPDEELLLVRRFVCHDLQQLCAHKRVRALERVQMLAAVYFSRVYAVRSMMEVCGGGVLDPRVVMCTCVLLAAKVEEAKDLDAAALESGAHLSRQLILALEPDVLTALHFDLCAHSPLACLDGYLQALGQGAGGAPPEPAAVEPAVVGAPAADGSLAVLRSACVQAIFGPALRCDALLRFSPHQVALAALGAQASSAAGRAAGLEPFLRTHFPGFLADPSLEPVRLVMREMAAAAESEEAQDAAAIEQLYHRLKLCHQRAKAAGAAGVAAAASSNAGVKRKLGPEAAAPVDTDNAGEGAPQTKLHKS
ncbi:hypothetical protein T492DRAFT_941239 [Pavlovales sp. CCMP2436]|nr:hypothetical protein T492DRAFT_941239 [Pavlovales sp. CCMP2436]